MKTGILHRTLSSRLSAPPDSPIPVQRSSSYHGFSALSEIANCSNGRCKVSDTPFEKELKDTILCFRQYLGITTNRFAGIPSLDEVLYDTWEVLKIRYPKCLSRVQGSGASVSIRQALLYLYKVLKFVKDSWKIANHHTDQLQPVEDASLDTSDIEQIADRVYEMLKAASSPKLVEMFESAERSIDDERSSRAGKKRKMDHESAGTEPTLLLRNFPNKILAPVLTRQRRQSLAVVTPTLPYAFFNIPPNSNYNPLQKLEDDAKDDILDDISTSDPGLLSYTSRMEDDNKTEDTTFEEDNSSGATSTMQPNSFIVIPSPNKTAADMTPISSPVLRVFLAVEPTPTPPPSPMYLDCSHAYCRTSSGRFQMAAHVPFATILENKAKFAETEETNPLENLSSDHTPSSPSMIFGTPMIVELVSPTNLRSNQSLARQSSKSKTPGSMSAPSRPPLPPLSPPALLKNKTELQQLMSPSTVLLPPSPHTPPSSQLKPINLRETQKLLPSPPNVLVPVSVPVSSAPVPLPQPSGRASSLQATPPPPPPPSVSYDQKEATRPPPPPVPPIGTPQLMPGKAPPLPPPPPGGAQKGLASPPLPPPPPGGAQKGNAPPPPPPPGGAAPSLKGGAPPPPPPGARALRAKNTKLKRSSHMGNLYRLLKVKVEGASLTAKASRGKKNQGASGANKSQGQGMADALAEMTKRSSYFQQIEDDVKKYSKPILKLKGELSSFQTKDMAELAKFHKHVEQYLECLTDETQVLARFEGFPSKKLESLRMAATLYSKLEGMVSALKGWKLTSPILQQLDKIESSFNKIKEEVDVIVRTKDEEVKRFKSQNIDFDFSILVKIKEATVDLSSNCIEIALKERKAAKELPATPTVGGKNQQGTSISKLLWRAFQFAFRVYNFAGGQDERADRLTAELAQEIETNPA